MILGKVKKHPDDPDAYALYAAHRMVAGDNNNLLCIGAPGSGKSRGFIIPFLWAAQSAASPHSSRMRRESCLNVFLHISGSTASM